MSTNSIAEAPAGARLIPLTQGQFAIVDAADFERLNATKWCAQWSPDTKSFYAVRNSYRDANGERYTIRMHREIISAPKCLHVDHENHNTLDNRRENLRVCTGKQNQANTKTRSDNTSGFKGVDWHKQSEKWRARVRVNGRKKHIGLFATALEAALAYDLAAISESGSFALTNEKLGLLHAKTSSAS